MTKRDLANAIVDAAVEQGATAEMISRWTLMRGDEDLVRAEYPSADYPAECITRAEWRSIMYDIELMVRLAGVDMLAANESL